MNVLIYLLQVSACTTIFYLFYYLLLSRLTFFVINRLYLLASLLLSFIIPLLSIPVNPQAQQIAVVQQAVYVNTLQVVPVEITNTQDTAAAAKPMDWVLPLKMFYFTVVIALAIQLVITLINFFKRIKGVAVTKIGHVNILRGNHQFTNGSFFNYIFLNDEELSADEMQQIIAHEMLHVNLYHSVDRLLVKIAQILLWFNPFIYFYAKSVEENHEFEVDCAIANSTDKKIYADLLLHLSVAGQGLLYHSFSKIPLKKRISMLFNKPSSNMKKIVYVLIVPVVLISCLAFARLKSNYPTYNKESKPKKSLFQKLKIDDNLFVNKQNEDLGDKNSIKKLVNAAIDTIKYRQKLKRTLEQIEGEAKFKAWRQSDNFKQTEKLAKEITGKTITVKVKEVVNKEAVKNLDIMNTGNHKTQGYMISYNGNDYFMRTMFGQEKQLNNLLKVGDEITIKVFESAFGRNSPIIIQPAFIVKDNVKIFQLAEAGKIPTYPFLYETNKVRFADGQITHIQKYPNGKSKSAIIEIVNGYKFNLNFKPTAPDFNNIEESDHVRFRFVHEVKTGAKTYQINDWVSISKDIKDYGIKNPDFFYKFYEPDVAKNQAIERSFKVTKLTYNVPENVLVPFKNDQLNSYISEGKTINVSILKKEQERVFKFLLAKFPKVEKSNIIFRVDTTEQKGFCTVETVVKFTT